MPTPESAEAFAKVVAARARLTEISNDLRTAFAAIQSTAAHSDQRKEAERRYDELQTQWDEAFLVFEQATEEFATAVKHVHTEVEARHAKEDRRKRHAP